MRDQIEAKLQAAEQALAKYPKGSMNLTPDDVRTTPEWQSEKRVAETAFHRLRTFNSRFVKTYKKEIAAERRARFP